MQKPLGHPVPWGFRFDKQLSIVVKRAYRPE